MILVPNPYLSKLFFLIGIPCNSDNISTYLSVYTYIVYLLITINSSFFVYQLIYLKSESFSHYIEFERTLTGLVQLIVIHKQRQTWIDLGSKIGKVLTEADLLRLNKVSLKLLSFVIIVWIFEFYSWTITGSIDQYFDFFYSNNINLTFTLKVIVLYLTYIIRIPIIHGIVYISIIFFIHYFYSVHLIYTRLYRYCKIHLVSNQLSESNLISFRLTWSQLTQIKRQSEETLNNLTIIWFGRYFFESFLCLLRATRTNKGQNSITWTYLVDKWTIFSQLSLSLIILIVFVDCITCFDIKLSNWIRFAYLPRWSNLSGIEINLEVILFESELSRVPFIPITINRLVVIRRAFIPIYVSTLVQIVVMALDLF